MTLSDYCYKKGMNLQQYETFKENIINTATAIIQNVKSMYNTDTGIYYPINEILAFNTDETMKQFIVEEYNKLLQEENNIYKEFCNKYNLSISDIKKQLESA